MNNYNHLSWDDIKAMFAETEKFIKETSFQMKENDRKIAESRAETDRIMAESKVETDRIVAESKVETDRIMAESRAETERIMAESKAEMEKTLKETSLAVKELSRNIGGISNSNGEMAEEYFYNSFKADTTFANEKFDRVEKNAKATRDGIEAEFDIILVNGKSAAVIEVKYSAKPDNIQIDNLIERVDIFKKLYPEHKNHNIYLGVAAMSFKSGLETKLHKAGIATIKQIGKKMVVFDKNVKTF